ncbi:unnamed protein product, partial [Symbiodinium sp. CCMP2456]
PGHRPDRRPAAWRSAPLCVRGAPGRPGDRSRRCAPEQALPHVRGRRLEEGRCLHPRSFHP